MFAFLTTDANAEVAPIHPKAMPAILTSEEDVDVWINVMALQPYVGPVKGRPIPGAR